VLSSGEEVQLTTTVLLLQAKLWKPDSHGIPLTDEEVASYELNATGKLSFDINL